MAELKSLYDNDFLAWSKQQAETLRAATRNGSNQSLDFENLAEEIEDLGKSVRRELQSQIRRVVRHLLNLKHSPAKELRRGWAESVVDARAEIEDLLEASPNRTGPRCRAPDAARYRSRVKGPRALPRSRCRNDRGAAGYLLLRGAGPRRLVSRGAAELARDNHGQIGGDISPSRPYLKKAIGS